MEPRHATQIRAASRAMVREFDLLDAVQGACTIGECHALLVLARYGPLTSAQLGRHLGLEKSTISRKVARLRRRGLVSSDRDPRDRRYHRIALTRAGRTLVRHIDRRADRRVEGALALLAADQRERVVAGFRDYTDALARSRLRGSARVRPIRRQDDVDLAYVIRRVMMEFDMASPAFAYVDAEVDRMYAHYRKDGHAFFVATIGGEVVGGAGVAPLRAGPDDTCELRKMYLLPEARGRGLGRSLLARCLDAAKRVGYGRCYLETMPQLEIATALYEAAGFERLAARMGDTGHPGCTMHYALRLDRS